jgi:hypothetical protein
VAAYEVRVEGDDILVGWLKGSGQPSALSGQQGKETQNKGKE